MLEPILQEDVEKLDPEQMWQALTAIAEEVQKFLGSPQSSPDSDVNASNDEGHIEDKLNFYKDKLKSREQVIKCLKDNLKTACVIAKTALSDKENYHISYNNELTLARKESACLLKKNTESCEKLQKLIPENRILTETLHHIRSFIDLGYLELQKMRQEPPEDLPPLMKLKKIMISCGQYYADYCNERDKTLQLEQKNRYLKNKVYILENGIAGLTDELMKLKRPKSGSTDPQDNKRINKFGRVQTVRCVYSDFQLGKWSPGVSSSSLTVIDKSQPSHVSNRSQFNHVNNLDLSSHFTLLKNLLHDQDSMLNDLKTLAAELNIIYAQSI